VHFSIQWQAVGTWYSRSDQSVNKVAKKSFNFNIHLQSFPHLSSTINLLKAFNLSGSVFLSSLSCFNEMNTSLLKLVFLLVQNIFFANAFITFACTEKPTTRTFRSANTFKALHAKKKFKINTNISADVSSDGLLTERKSLQENQNSARDAVKSNLGMSSKKKMSSNSGAGQGVNVKKLSKKAEKLAKQRNGDVDSTLQAGIAVPEDQDVQIKVAKRGSKFVTIVRGLTSPMDDRKKLLKEMKSKLGGGGSIIEGVVSLLFHLKFVSVIGNI
jgi:translation initiation factor 1 (eIF-1/SUI1)